MKRKRFSVEQIVAVLKQVELGFGCGFDPPGRHFRADFLPMEEAVLWVGVDPGSRT